MFQIKPLVQSEPRNQAQSPVARGQVDSRGPTASAPQDAGLTALSSAALAYEHSRKRRPSVSFSPHLRGAPKAGTHTDGNVSPSLPPPLFCFLYALLFSVYNNDAVGTLSLSCCHNRLHTVETPCGKNCSKLCKIYSHSSGAEWHGCSSYLTFCCSKELSSAKVSK